MCVTTLNCSINKPTSHIPKFPEIICKMLKMKKSDIIDFIESASLHGNIPK